MESNQPKIHRNHVRTASYVFVALLILAVEWIWGWSTLLAPWRSLEASTLVGATLLLLLTYVIRAKRLHGYQPADQRGAFLPTLKVILYHNLINTLMPMRAGEAAFPLLLKWYHGASLKQSTATLIWFRILDLHSILTLAAVALGVLALQVDASGLVAAAFLLWLSVPLILYWLRGSLRTRLDRARPFAYRWLETVAEIFVAPPESFGVFLRTWFYTVVNWSLKLAALGWVLQQFHPLSLLTATWAVAAADLTSVLPIHLPAGAGTYESGVLAALLPLGFETDGILRAAINLHLFHLSNMLLGAAVGFLIPAKRGQPTAAGLGRFAVPALDRQSKSDGQVRP